MNVAYLIMARSGSKSIEHKNLRTVGGKSLIARAVDACLNSHDGVVLFSTNSALYMEEARRAAENVHHGLAKQRNWLHLINRPPALAEDVPSEYVVMHALNYWEEKSHVKFDIVCNIQCTTPFVQAVDIDACVQMLEKHPSIQSCITVRRVKEHPDWMMREVGDINTALIPLKKGSLNGERGVRQTLSELFIPTGGCYATRVPFLMEQKKLIADKTLFVETPTWRSIDIDDTLDLTIAEAL